MRGELEDGVDISVVLSERNLIGLLTKLHTEGSACTLITNDVKGARSLSVSAERDTLHYGSRVPGPMHPISEAASRLVKEAMEPATRRYIPNGAAIRRISEDAAQHIADEFYEDLPYEVQIEDNGGVAEALTEEVFIKACDLIEEVLRRGVPR